MFIKYLTTTPMFTDINEAAARQYIDAEQTWKALLAAERRAVNYRGSMFWKKTGEREYLCRQYNSLQSKSLGVRSPETEHILEEFKQGKAEAETNQKGLEEVVARHKRVNTALRVGRTPNTVINLLEEIRKAGLQEHFLVIGTNALYAYETHAGVRFNGDITATTDVDLLWDSRKRITLLSDGDEHFTKHGLLGIIKKADPTFELQPGGEYRAVNSSGYMIDLIKRRPKSLFDDKEPQQLIKNENDFWATKIINMDWLLSSPRFRQVVVGVNGAMSEMVTIDPRAFVLYKMHLSEKEDRDPVKIPRDIAQARAIFNLIQERLPHLSFDKMSAMPERLRNDAVISSLNGNFLGKITSIVNGVATQNIGRKVIEHKIADLDKDLKVGDIVQIFYSKDGHGKVNNAQHNKTKGTER